MTEVSSRSVALDCLMLTAEERRFSHTVLNDAREKYAWMSEEDRAFFGRLFHGTLEYLYQADRILDRRSSVRTGKMKPVIRNILRMGVYQILYMDRVPDRAAISEAVKLTEKRGLRGLKGFVNAVLRRVSAEREEILQELSRTEDLSYKYSVPAWMAELFVSAMGKETACEAMQSFLSPGISWVRISGGGLPPQETAGELAEQEYVRAELCPDVWHAASGAGLPLKLLEQGAVYVQDLSSALAVRAAAPAPGETVVDLCAAPGGKSIAAAGLMEGKGRVLSFDLTDRKTEQIRQNAERCGFGNMIRAEAADALVLKEDLRETADLVIADLPCSGLGVLGQKPDIKLNADPGGLKTLASLQRDILKNAAQYVKPGGRLLFSTCTVNPGENEENRAWFLREHPEFSPADLRERLPELAAAEKAAVSGGKIRKESLSEGYITLIPGVYPCDGFFFSLFMKRT